MRELIASQGSNHEKSRSFSVQLVAYKIASSAKSVGKTAPSPSLSFQFAVHQKHNTKRCLIFDDGLL
ncbi:MAG: hypothetical protein PF904_16145, partial [Kiritimatiellae bacterium]|nr:hypothetical protein [Kiritimatiellia bacterium]